jgi:serine/threonine protein kinase
MDQIRTSLENLFKRCDKQCALKTVLMIGDQMLRIIEWVHSCGVLHRDIKPQNFFVGRGQFRNKIYLNNFGISAPYLDQRMHQHQIYTRGNVLVGTADDFSINTRQNSIPCLMAIGNFMGNGHCFVFDAALLLRHGTCSG